MTYPKYIIDTSTKGNTPSPSNTILEHEENNIDEESTVEHDPILTNSSSKNRSLVDIDENKERRKSNENDNNNYNSVSLNRIVAPVKKIGLQDMIKILILHLARKGLLTASLKYPCLCIPILD